MNPVVRAGAVAGLVALALAPGAQAAGPAGVTVRVEGQAETIVPRTALTTTTAPVSKDGEHSCPGTSAIGALDVATAGDWDGAWSFSQQVERIRGESHVFDPDAAANRYWTFWLNHRFQNAGACDTELQEGDEVLFFPDCFGDCASQAPLRLEIPPHARPGEPVQAKVVQYGVAFGDDGGSTTEGPATGATVTAGGRTFTTDGQGVANVVLDERGPAGARASKPDFVRSATETVCVSDGADGFCGTATPGAAAPPAPACVTDGADGRCGTRDRRAPQARITGIGEQQRFTRRSAPRELTGSVEADPSGLHVVKLRLTRRHRGRCWYFSGSKEAWRRTRCGRAFRFAIGDRADWSYLLPKRPRRGRYVLDVIAVDRAFNRDTLARGRNRVVFHVV